MSNNYLNSDKHKKEHSHWDRRGFLKVLGIAGAGSISLANSHLSVINSSFVSINRVEGLQFSPFFVLLSTWKFPGDSQKAEPRELSSHDTPPVACTGDGPINYFRNFRLCLRA